MRDRDQLRCQPQCARAIMEAHGDVRQLGLNHPLNQSIGLQIHRGRSFIQYQDFTASTESSDQRH
jgi:hypothetical protein